MKRFLKVAAACVAIASMPLFTSGCSGVSEQAGGATRVSSVGGSCDIYIIEKDGYKFAVAVGSYKCAITQIQ